MIPELALDPAPARRPRDPSAMRRVLVPVAVAAGALAVLGTTQLLFDPFTRDVPLCPVHAMTGLLCPGCGMTRAVHALTAGDPVLAVRSNALVLLLVPAAVLGWARWFRARLRGVPAAPWRPGTRGRAALIVLAVLVVAYAVARNLPALAVLAPVTSVGA